MKKSTFILTSAIMILIGEAFGQTFTRTYSSEAVDYNHYSIERDGNSYILAGTLFDKKSNETDIHVFKTDSIGNILWERFIDESEDDRALDLCFDNAGNIAVTGYITYDGTQNLYAVLIDGSGNFISDTKDILESGVSAGTNIIYSRNRNEFIVGGYRGSHVAVASNPPYVDHGNAIVIRFNSGLGYIDHTELVSTVIDFHGSVNDIVEIHNSDSLDGYFITGTLGKGENNETSVLAVRLDYGLNLIYNASFESSINDKGVSAVYNEENQQVTVLSNNSSSRKPQISVIDDNGGAHLSSRVLNIVSNVQNATSSAFHMIESVNNSSNIVIAGYFDEYLVGGATNNVSPWIVELTPSGTIINSFIQAVPSGNFAAHGGGIFSTFINPHPYIFNQEILSTTSRGGYALLNPRTISGSYGIQASFFNFSNAIEVCFESNDPYTFSLCNPLVQINNYFPVKEFAFYGATLGIYRSNIEVLCGGDVDSGEKKLRIKPENGISEVKSSANIFPNPFNKSLTIEVLGTDLKGDLEVVNVNGKVIYKENIEGNNFKTVLNMEGMSNGIYFIKYNNGDKQEVIKAIKM